MILFIIVFILVLIIVIWGSVTNWNFICKNNSEYYNYWTNIKSDNRPNNLPEPDKNKYLTFEIDIGGFNNIRESFEVNIICAILTGRVLVIPPAFPWHQIDYGRMTRGYERCKDNIKKMNKDKIKNMVTNSISDLNSLIKQLNYYKCPRKLKEALNKGYTTDFTEIFNMNALNSALPSGVLTHEEFYNKESKNLNIPKSVKNSYQNWKEWVRKQAGISENDKVFIFEDNQDKIKGLDFKISEKWNFSNDNKDYKYSDKLKNATLLHQPSGGTGTTGVRFLFKIYDKPLVTEDNIKDYYLNIIKHGVRYSDDIFQIAEDIVEFLGGFMKYTSLHIRRNDLQYKKFVIESDKSYNNIKKILSKGENIYIATDETDNDFFKTFENNGHKVFKWADVIYKKDDASYTKNTNIKINPKWEGMIEQIVCASGRNFIGTEMSTFSDYIRVLEKYLKEDDNIKKHSHNIKEFFKNYNNKLDTN